MNLKFLAAASLLALTPAAMAASGAAAQARATTAVNPDRELLQFFADYDKAQLARSPLGKAYRGIRDGDYGKWDEQGEAAERRDYEADLAALKAMRTRFDPVRLKEDNRLSYRLFEKMIERRAAAFEFRDHGYVFDQMNGPQSQYPAFLINIHRVETKSDAEAYVSRLNGLGPAIDQLVADSRDSAAKGLAPPKWVYAQVISDSKNVISGFPFSSAGDEAPLYADLKTKVGKLAIPQAEKDALLRAGADALTGPLRTRFKTLKKCYARADDSGVEAGALREAEHEQGWRDPAR